MEKRERKTIKEQINYLKQAYDILNDAYFMQNRAWLNLYECGNDEIDNINLNFETANPLYKKQCEITLMIEKLEKLIEE